MLAGTAHLSLFVPMNMVLKRYWACRTFCKYQFYSNESYLSKRTYAYEISADNQLHNRDEHRSRLKPILAESGLDRTASVSKIGGSGLDQTEKICCFDVTILTTSSMLVVMWFCRWLNGNVYSDINGKSSAGTILVCIQLCPDFTYSVEFMLLVTRWM